MSAASVVSADSASSFIDQALQLVSEMSFSDKLAFNAKLASLLAKETKGAGAVAKAAKKEKKEKDPDAPKRVAGAGQKAWFAYIEFCINTMPERFTNAALRKEKLAVVAAIRAEDKAGYDSFVAKYKEEHPVAAADASDAESTSSAPAKPKGKPGPKPKAAKAAEAADAAEEKPAAAEKPSSEKPMTAAEKIAALKAKKAAAASTTAPAEKKEKKKTAKGSAPAASAAAASESDGSLARITIDGADYHRDTGMNGLWKVGDDGESFGAWVGYYQPGNKDEPIRYTESPSDE